MTLQPPLALALAEGGSFNPFAFDPGAMLLTLITFLALLLLLWKFAWGPILGMVEAREKRIDDAIRQAEDDRTKAQGVLDDYTRRVSGVEQEMAAIRDKGRAEAEAMRREILDTAQAEAKDIAAKATREIEQAKSQALEDLRKEAVEIGLAIAGKVVGRSVDGEDQRRLADQVIAGMGRVDN